MSYNYGSAAEVLDNVFDVIEGGQSATATGEVIADNGAKIFDIATKEVYAANGSAAEVAEVVSVGEGATVGTTAGAGILAVDVGVAGAAIAPALGIAAGFGLYNLAPEFWNNVSEQLVNAGQTVKGKVQALLMPDGSTAFSKETIEIFKNALLQAGAFSSHYSPQTTSDAVTVRYRLTNSQIFNTLTMSAANYNNVVNNSYSTPLIFKYGDEQLGYKYAPLYLTMKNDGEEISRLVSPILNFYMYRNENNIGCLFWVNLSEILNSGDIGIGYYNEFTESINIIVSEDFASIQGTIIENIANGVNYIIRLANMNYINNIIENNNIANIGDYVYDIYYHSATYLSTVFNNALKSSNTQNNAVLPSSEPFENTYPNWLPWEFPQGLPSELPDYYPVSIPTPDITQDPSQSGENAADSQLDKLIELLFNSLPEPDPQIEPDPDAGIDPDPEPATQPNPDPNPPDPNPPLPTPSAGVPLPTVETTRADRMFTVYNPTDTEVNNLGAFLWTSSIIEQIKKLWDDPMQAIISFHKIYGTPTVGSSREIVLGYIESGVNAAVVTSQFCEVDCGSVTVPELNKNATSYSPFTSLHIYLPFVGIMELDTNECMNATLHVKYRIDVYTGTCIAMIYVSRTPDLPNEQMLYSFSGNASQQLPLTSSSFGGAVSALLGLAGAGVAVASGGALGVAAGAVSAAHSLTQEMVHINRSGGLSANAGILAPRKPYLILSRQYSSDANGYAGFYGYPSNKTVYIGNCNGYIKCKDVIFRGSCTQAEVNEIESLLKSGVYV